MLRRREVWILVPIQLVGIVVFLFGFFPQKVPLQGSGSFEEMPSPGNCTIRQDKYIVDLSDPWHVPLKA